MRTRTLVLLTAVAASAAYGYAHRFALLDMLPVAAIPIAAHDQYAIGLRLTGIAATAGGKEWQDAAESSLALAPAVSLQHQRTISFAGDPGQVVSWRVAVRRGQRLSLTLVAATDTLFLDVFRDEGKMRVASSAPGGLRLDHLVEQDDTVIVRVQPRLGVVQSVRAGQEVTAGFLFPVPAVSGRAVQSGFGAARDAGARRHEGVDIFAPRETPVVAAADGRIGSQTANRLGGNVVWLRASATPVSFYYAHLTRQAVRPGDRVTAGDVVGYVGNTGNARTTRPHLHFGVYATGGAVDPLPFVVDPPGFRFEAAGR